ncbi:hypothetical protein C1645_861119 [Glomus cerebriforme]|uniref:Uncharacterized protein n=1 Tax=Glomus cerebriforme TaxID=658196 RepID=A0A397SAB7_9GLOM|nr:hypothetical protein C1645_861119 [Glomus cerebriforme]
MVNAQEWLDQNYPKEIRKEIKQLNISKKDLEEKLDLSDFIELQKLNCSHNCLTNLNISQCKKLKDLRCDFNKLTRLDIENLKELEKIDCNDNCITDFDHSSLNPDKLTYLNITDNNFPKQDLSIFSKFLNLETL